MPVPSRRIVAAVVIIVLLGLVAWKGQVQFRLSQATAALPPSQGSGVDVPAGIYVQNQLVARVGFYPGNTKAFEFSKVEYDWSVKPHVLTSPYKIRIPHQLWDSVLTTERRLPIQWLDLQAEGTKSQTYKNHDGRWVALSSIRQEGNELVFSLAQSKALNTHGDLMGIAVLDGFDPHYRSVYVFKVAP